MPQTVLIVPDKFKGTLTAQAAAQAMARGWAQVHPADRLELLPMSDGGDGFGEILGGLLHAEVRTVNTIDAAHRARQAHWWWAADRRAAMLESAQVIGLALLPEELRDPLRLDTQGLAAVLHEIQATGAEECLVGIGGSATNDAGFGLARALGWQFIDTQHGAIETWTDLDSLIQIIPPARPIKLPKIRVAVDVQNPLLGASGCTRVYGPQKGLSEADFMKAEACLERLAQMVQETFPLSPALAPSEGERGHRLDFASEPGSGAAGGLGFGFRVFLDATLEPGFDIFSRLARLEEKIRAADLVITGEGAIDRSTLMGKGVGKVAEKCRASGVPCLGLAGTLESGVAGEATDSFTRVYGIVPGLATAEAATAEAERWLSNLAIQAAKEWPTTARQSGN